MTETNMKALVTCLLLVAPSPAEVLHQGGHALKDRDSSGSYVPGSGPELERIRPESRYWLGPPQTTTPSAEIEGVCPTNPCKNGGTCTRYSSRAYGTRDICTCKYGFSGDRCETADLVSSDKFEALRNEVEELKKRVKDVESWKAEQDAIYEKVAAGSLCSDKRSEVTTEVECKKAAERLGLSWGAAWNGPNDFPECFLAEDWRNKVYFNLSPNPKRTNVYSKYAAICYKE